MNRASTYKLESQNFLDPCARKGTGIITKMFLESRISYPLQT